MGVMSRIRKRTFEVMEVGRPDDSLSRLVDGLIMALVAGNVLAVILESVPHLGKAYEDLFLGFEQVSVSVFTAELMCRFWAAREKGGGVYEPLAAPAPLPLLSHGSHRHPGNRAILPRRICQF